MRMNTKNTELQKSFCEMKNFANEPLNVSAVALALSAFAGSKLL